MRKKILVVAVAFYVIAAAGAIAAGTVSRTQLIIDVGIAAADIIIASGWALAACAFLAGTCIIVSKRRVLRPHVHAQRRKEYPLNSKIKPADIREEIARLLALRPELKGFLAPGISQMDSIDRKQDKLGEILARNDAGSLEEVAVTLDSAEQALCKNMVKMLNRAILWDHQEADKPGKEAVFESHKKHIGTILGKNEDILTMCDALLSETVGYLNERSSGDNDGAYELEAMTRVMRSLRGLNSDDGE
jgi:hypothetical protein